MSKKKKKDASRVEFGNEFGDLNAAKNYEVPFASREKKDVGRKKKKQ
ncbi:hypothetical protein [Robertmurraya massiliosenegalensis]|nr:hypothetical protein [Robertmurraya massiliosenegalensis]